MPTLGSPEGQSLGFNSSVVVALYRQMGGRRVWTIKPFCRGTTVANLVLAFGDPEWQFPSMVRLCSVPYFQSTGASYTPSYQAEQQQELMVERSSLRLPSLYFLQKLTSHVAYQEKRRFESVIGTVGGEYGRHPKMTLGTHSFNWVFNRRLRDL